MRFDQTILTTITPQAILDARRVIADPHPNDSASLRRHAWSILLTAHGRCARQLQLYQISPADGRTA